MFSKLSNYRFTNGKWKNKKKSRDKTNTISRLGFGLTDIKTMHTVTDYLVIFN